MPVFTLLYAFKIAFCYGFDGFIAAEQKTYTQVFWWPFFSMSDLAGSPLYFEG